jgi:malate synthase
LIKNDYQCFESLFMADLEDSNVPTWKNAIEGQ